MPGRRWSGVLLGGLVFLTPLLPGRGLFPAVRVGGAWFVAARDSSGRSLLKVISGKVVNKVKLPLCCVMNLTEAYDGSLVVTPRWAQAFIYDTALNLVDSVCLKTHCGCKTNSILDPAIFLAKDGKLLCVGRYHVGNERYALAHLWDREGNFIKPLALFDSTWTTEEVALSPVSRVRKGDTLVVWSFGWHRVYLLSLIDGSLIKALDLKIPEWAALVSVVPLSKGLLAQYARREKVGSRFEYTLKRWALFSYSGKLEEGEGWFPSGYPSFFAVLPGDTLLVLKDGKLWLAKWE